MLTFSQSYPKALNINIFKENNISRFCGSVVMSGQRVQEKILLDVLFLVCAINSEW